MKQCSKCTLSKPMTEYFKFKRSPDGHQSACKECMKESYTKCRNEKIDHYRIVMRNRYKRNAERYHTWKATQKCSHCSEDNPVCLDLHHKDPSKKDINVSDAILKWGWDRLEKEIVKCVVLCDDSSHKEHVRLKLVVGVAGFEPATT